MTKADEEDLAYFIHYGTPKVRSWALYLARMRLRAELSERQNHRCCFCGVRFSGSSAKGDRDSCTIEHVVPRVLGGIDEEANMVVSCYRCNTKRGSYLYWPIRLVGPKGDYKVYDDPALRKKNGD